MADVWISQFEIAPRGLTPSDHPRTLQAWISRARGEGHEHSDLDIALIVAPGGRARRYAVYDLAFDVGLEHSVDLAPLVLEEQQLQELRRRERLVALDIEREGIAL